MNEVPREEKLRLFAGAVYNAAEIGMWCFGLDHQLFYSTCSCEKEFLMFLELGGGLDYVYKNTNGCDRPTILSDTTGLVWVAEHVYKNGRPVLLIVMGPVFLSSTSMQNIETSLRNMNLSIAARKQMLRILTNVPVVMMSMFNQYSIMLHYMITDKPIRPSEFLFQTDTKQPSSNQQDDTEPTLETAVDSERKAIGERLLLQAVREGNLNYMQIMEESADFGGAFLSHTGDSLRDAKNTALIFCALCSRAATEGGVPTASAQDLERYYITQIEECTTLTKLTNLNSEMLREYVFKVNEGRQNPQISSAVRQCCDYVHANILKLLTVEKIAKEMGYTEYYFTKKFYQEMGIRLTDYIKEARIEYAKITLITTRKSIQEISDSLHFGSRNYFSKVFHDTVGLTPAVYREHMSETSAEVNPKET